VILSAGTYAERKRAVVVELTTTIDGGAVLLIDRGISTAESLGADLIIIKINTYGGYLGAADSIISKIKESRIDCISWIPPGGKAVSAGSLIALACSRIYMSPGSVIGAAEPQPKDEKIMNYVKGRFRTLAEEVFQGNETLVAIAEEFTTANRVLTDNEAVALGFAYPVNDLNDLMYKLDADIVDIVSPGLWEGIISAVSTPLISSLLFMLGIALIVFEILQVGFQGYVLPGVILIVLALYAMYLVPIDMLIIVVMLAGLVLIGVEMYVPGFGLFGISGVALIVLGSYLAIIREPYGILTSVHYAILFGIVAFSALFGYIIYAAGKTMRLKKIKREDRLLGMKGLAKTAVTKDKPGVVYVDKEDWTAYAVTDEEIGPSEEVIVVRVEGLKLFVKKAHETDQ
jgi:membrane-bound serine protease (ClpP class)